MTVVADVTFPHGHPRHPLNRAHGPRAPSLSLPSLSVCHHDPVCVFDQWSKPLIHVGRRRRPTILILLANAFSLTNEPSVRLFAEVSAVRGVVGDTATCLLYLRRVWEEEKLVIDRDEIRPSLHEEKYRRLLDKKSKAISQF